MNTVPQIKKTTLRLIPPVRESKKVSFDDNYIKVPRELLRAVHRARFTEVEADVFWAIYEKVIGWHKETDRIVNEQICELSEREPTKSNINMIGEAKKRLIARQIIITEGKKLGINLAISEWKNPTQTGKKSIPVKVGKNSHSDLVFNPTLTGNTKDHNKRSKNNTPLPPTGENTVSENLADEQILAEAKTLLVYYNELAKSTCRDAKPFVPLLTKTKTREAYSLEDIKLVLKWVLRTWERKNGSAAKPKNICRIERFDGYLSDAMVWQKNQSLYQGVVDAYNEILGDRLVPMNELDTLAEKQIQGLLPHLKNPSVDAFVAYFETFAENAKPFYFEPERKFGFSFLMKPETLVKTRRQEL